MSYKIAPLILSPAKNLASTSDVLIAQPDSIKEGLAGKLFILIEVINHKTKSLKIINYLLDRINFNYYQNEKIILRERISSLTVEHIFETSLAKTNVDFGEFLKTEKLRIRDLEMNITVGVVHDNTLYFSNCGKNRVFLIYRQKKAAASKTAREPEDEDKIYKIRDITAQAGANDAISKDKIFANVISGNIPSSGQFIISNEALPEYISTKQLIQIVSTLPPVSAVEQIKNTLSGINAYVSFLGIIIKSSTGGEPGALSAGRPPSDTQDSILDLNRTEETTENLLAPTGLINFKKWLQLPREWLSTKGKAEPGHDSLILKDKIYSKKKNLNLIKKFFALIANIITYLINSAYYLLKIISNKSALKQSWQASNANIRVRLQKILSNILTLNKKNKILLMVAIVFLLFFSIGIYYNRAQNEKQAIEENFQELAQLIEKKQNQAEASLLYSNEEGAKKLFEEITSLMEQFPQATDEQKERYQIFKDKLEAQLEKTRRVTRVDDTPELANIRKLNERAKGDNIIFMPSQNKLYLADSAQKSIYVFDTSNNLITTITDLEHPIASLSHPTPVKSGVIYYFNNGLITEFNTVNQTLSGLGLNLGADINEFKDIDTFNERLYVLYPAGNQIYRYNRSGNDFGSAYAWIGDNSDLSQAIDMSIDGHVFVLMSDGQVWQFLRGQKTDFKLEAIDPPLTSPQAIKVSRDQEFIYIMEPSEKRLVVFNKDGQFVLQYKSDKFGELVDFSVDEAGRIIYILSGSSIYGIEASHINN